MIAVPRRLTLGLEPEEVAEFEAAYRANRWMLAQIAKVLSKDLQKLIKESEEEEKYSYPAWAEFQSDNLGQRKALRRLIKLLPTDGTEEEDEDGK